MKKLFSLLLAFSIVIAVFSGCRNSRGEAKLYGDEVSGETLRVCIDSAMFDPSGSSDESEHIFSVGVFLENLAKEIKSACGIEKLTFEMLPVKGAEREAALLRLRTEIMAGGGPDLFIMDTRLNISEFEQGLESQKALFNFPQKNMESGLFLPLDEYMENHTQFTDWSKQTQAVMDAGRNEEGQLIIPLVYTLPIWVYPKDKVDPSISEMTMWGILENPETAELGAVLYSSHSKSDEYGNREISIAKALPYVLGELTDYETEELLFTEDELYKVIETAYSLRDEVDKNQQPFIKSGAEYDLVYQINLAYFDREMTLVPLYSMGGGVTASIRSYAAVNRNTKHPEEAFSVIDYIMQEDMQRSSHFYNKYFTDGLPMQNDLGQEGKSLHSTSTPERVLTQPYFEDFLAIKEQISAANFESALDGVIENFCSEMEIAGKTPDREDVSELYAQMKLIIGE